jgi:hypothetical protein
MRNDGFIRVPLLSRAVIHAFPFSFEPFPDEVQRPKDGAFISQRADRAPWLDLAGEGHAFHFSFVRRRPARLRKQDGIGTAS